MSTLKVLKEYLVGKGGYLSNPDNNGKTVMLSGAWGSGKTHFWQKKIEEDLTKELNEKNKACVYVSLYGKDNIEALKNEILFKAYESIKDENKIAKRAISAFGFGSRLLSVSVGGVRGNTGAVGDVVENFFESKKINEAESFLADGGLICLDDFERKSKHIDLNDLFGFIAQLAIDMNCKIVIILNSDVFEGEEANVFKTVKEKTVNKFFYFEPTIEELFNSIYSSDEKYERLDDYRDEILNAIKETEELTARIYIQVLDNCLEWVDKGYDSIGLSSLALTTIHFILMHKVLDYSEEVEVSHLQYIGKPKSYEYTLLEDYHYVIQKMSILGLNSIDYKEIKFNDVKLNIYSELSRRNDEEGHDIYPDETKKIVLQELKNNEKELSTIWKYGYRLYYMDRIDETTYNNIANFVKTGILLKKDEEVQ
ncbi:MAG: hypothetical protein COA92_01425 [Sulfurovum sp.]|nr:MAG: hypothetical protein COA92_01425 [Sulfurovum sp.]